MATATLLFATETATFERELLRLLGEAPGGWAVVKGDRIVGHRPGYWDAYELGCDEVGAMEPFAIMAIVPPGVEPEYPAPVFAFERQEEPPWRVIQRRAALSAR